jgi:hypothetical protein
MNARGAFLAHNARSNMNNAVGYNNLLPTFANVVLGTDGMGADMLEEFKFAAFRHRESQGTGGRAFFSKCCTGATSSSAIFRPRLRARLPRLRDGESRGARGPRALGLRSPYPLVGENIAGTSRSACPAVRPAPSWSPAL